MKHKKCKLYFVCPMKYFYEQGRLDKSWIEKYCQKEWEKCIRFQKEENGVFHPDNM